MVPPVGAEEAPHDWLYAEVEMPVDASGYRIRLTTYFTSEVDELVYGRGYDLGWGKSVGAYTIRSSGESLGVTVGPVRETWVVEPAQPEGFGLGGNLVVGGAVSAGEIIRMLVFLPGARVSGGFAGVEADGVFYPATITTGPGSELVRITDAGMGVALDDGDVVRGVNRVSRVVAEPIVGSVVWSGCVEDVLWETCETAWTSPGGERGVWTQFPGRGAGGRPSFSGGPGEWTFEWEGATKYDGFVAYAPVGHLWD